MSKAIVTWRRILESAAHDTKAPIQEVARQARLLMLGLTEHELQADEPPAAFLLTLKGRLVTYRQTYDLVAAAAGLYLIQDEMGHVTKAGELWTPRALWPLEFREVPANMAQLIEGRLHYLRSYRPDSFLRLGMFLRGQTAPLAYMAFAPCDRGYYIYGLQEYLRMHVASDRVVLLTRGYALNMPHSNSFSYMIRLVCKEYFAADFDLLATAVNPVLGFNAASLRATGFIPFAATPVIYRFTHTYEAIPRRQNRGDFRGTTVIRNLLTVRGCTREWTRRLAQISTTPVQIDFGLHSLSICSSPEELMSQSGKATLLNIRRHLESAWDRQTRYGRYAYSDMDRGSRGQCGVTSAFLARAVDRRGWHATIGRGDLTFDSDFPAIMNHCWVEVDMPGADPLIIDLTPDQTGFPEILLVGSQRELAALGAHYKKHSLVGEHNRRPKNDLGRRLSILDRNITKAVYDESY